MYEHITTALRSSRLPLGMTCEFVTEDCDAVDGATRLKVGLDVFGRRTIINLGVQGCLEGRERDRVNTYD